jgi:uncharacterized protein
MSMLPRPVLAFGGLLLAATVLAGCSRAPDGDGAAAGGTAVAPERTPFEHRFTIKVGDRPVQMRLAVQSHEQQRGLMHVKQMPEDEGMLFVYTAPQQMSFWMRNTDLPLDIGYFDAGGVLREIYPMYPHVEDPVRSRREDLHFALEMNQGWFARHEVKPGAQLDLGAVVEALRARGFEKEAAAVAK